MVGVLVEVTNTESGVLGKEPCSTNNEDIELMAKEIDYTTVKKMLLIMSGLEKNPGPGRTNKETLEFMKNLSSDYYSESNLESAKKFFNGFISDKKMLGTWREKVSIENKSVREKTQRRLMKLCGGSGKNSRTPPREYIPHSFVVDKIKCGKCLKMFETENDVKIHILEEHKRGVKEAFAKEALNMVAFDQKYMEWLEESALSLETNEQIQQANRVLTEMINSKNRNDYTKIKEENGVYEMQRQVLTTDADGSIKTSVVTQQFVEVTTRKRKWNDNVGTEQQTNTIEKREERQCKRVENVIKHLAGENLENQAGLVAKYLDQKGPEFTAEVNKQSKQLKENHKFTPEQTAAIAAATNMPDRTMVKLRTAHNKVFGSNPYASRHCVEKAQREILVVNSEDWEASEHDLYTHKQGNSVNQKKKTTVFSVKNLKKYIQKMAEAEKDNLKNLKDQEEIVVCFDADGGGGRFVAEFAFLNNIDRKIKIHPILIYEGVDTRPNLEVTLGKLTTQIKKLEGEEIIVDGRRLKIHQYGVFDLSALNTILGKQGHSATYFDAWTDVQLSHIRNHSNEIHTPDNCKDIKFLTLEDLDKNYTHHSVQNLTPSTAKQFGSVVANNLLPLRDINHYIPPVMHTIMGLGNLLFKELKKVAIKLDEEESNFGSEGHKDAEKELNVLYKRKEELTAIHANYSLDSMIVLNDRKRLSLMVAGELVEAEKAARENYDDKTNKKSKRKKKNCDASICLIYPCDEMNGYSDKTKCENGCILHARCEGIVLLDGEDLPESYECKRCLGFGNNDKWLRGTLKAGKLLFEDKIHEINTEMRQLTMEIETLEEETLKCGVRHGELKRACKNMKLDPSKYHGGDFEGKGQT